MTIFLFTEDGRPILDQNRVIALEVETGTSGFFLLLESSDKILLESGDRVLLEAA